MGCVLPDFPDPAWPSPSGPPVYLWTPICLLGSRTLCLTKSCLFTDSLDSIFTVAALNPYPAPPIPPLSLCFSLCHSTLPALSCSVLHSPEHPHSCQVPGLLAPHMSLSSRILACFCHSFPTCLFPGTPKAPRPIEVPHLLPTAPAFSLCTCSPEPEALCLQQASVRCHPLKPSETFPGPLR